MGTLEEELNNCKVMAIFRPLIPNLNIPFKISLINSIHHVEKEPTRVQRKRRVWILTLECHRNVKKR